MIILLNADNNLTLQAGYRDKLNGLLSDKFSRYSKSITRLEIHLSDANGAKKGAIDKKCLLEARLKGKQPIAVSEMADTHDNAVAGAIDKLKASLSTIQGRMQDH